MIAEGSDRHLRLAAAGSMREEEPAGVRSRQQATAHSQARPRHENASESVRVGLEKSKVVEVQLTVELFGSLQSIRRSGNCSDAGIYSTSIVKLER